MNGYSDEADVELPGRGDDRPGMDDLEELVVIVEDDFDDEPDDDEDDYPEDAAEDDIDLIVAVYREEGQPMALALDWELANDLDELINQLRRIPGDGGAIGLLSLAQEFFVIVRVRGKHIQALLSDGVAANDWPIARDVVDFLGVEVPDEEDESAPVGDLDILADSGISEFEMNALASDYDEDSEVLLEQVATKIRVGREFKKVVQAAFA